MKKYEIRVEFEKGAIHYKQYNNFDEADDHYCYALGFKNARNITMTIDGKRVAYTLIKNYRST